eukprot:SAG11_NODE_272_length_11319_cov_9.730481_3_plen_60_part_00
MNIHDLIVSDIIDSEAHQREMPTVDTQNENATLATRSPLSKIRGEPPRLQESYSRTELC